MAEDVMANVEGMYNDSGSSKGWYIGYSQGTNQMHVALTKYESQLSQWLNRVISLTPCFATYPEGAELNLSEEAFGEVGYWWDLGVHATNGPNWEEDKETICNSLGWWNCRWTKAIDRWNIAPYSNKNLDHWLQNTITQRYQEYVEDFSPENYEAPLYPIESLSTIPLTLIIGDGDDVCQPERAYETAETIPTIANVITIVGEDHLFPLRTGQLYLDTIAAELITEVPAEASYFEITMDNAVTSLVASSLISTLFLLANI